MVGLYLLGQWFSTLAAYWNHLGALKNILRLTFKNLNLINLGCGLASGLFINSSSDSDMQPSLKTTVLWGASEGFKQVRCLKSEVVNLTCELKELTATILVASNGNKRTGCCDQKMGMLKFKTPKVGNKLQVDIIRSGVWAWA